MTFISPTTVSLAAYVRFNYAGPLRLQCDPYDVYWLRYSAEVRYAHIFLSISMCCAHLVTNVIRRAVIIVDNVVPRMAHYDCTFMVM